MTRFLILGLLLAVPGFAPAQEDSPAKKQGANDRVPYRLTATQHVLVRVKLDGKGPYNFILDTGAPVSFVAENIGKKLGLKPDTKKFAVLDRFDIEGGPSLAKVKIRVETPFQLEGMNGMGLAGAELHGILGYTELARFRLTFDFSKDRMVWVPLDWQPPAPVGVAGKGGQGGMEWLGSLMKLLGGLGGFKTPEPPRPRGLVGLELAAKGDDVVVAGVLASGPSAQAGLKKGDVLLKIDGKDVADVARAHQLSSRIRPGQEIRLVVRRDGSETEITVQAGKGL